MKKLALVVANGTEEMEALVTVDVLRRGGVICDIISASSTEFVQGSHGIIFKGDKLSCQFDMDEYDGIIIPGGMPGATNISDSKIIVESLKKAMNDGKLVAAICASPAVVLEGNGILRGQKATCYPAEDFIKVMKNYTGADVEADGNVITANGPKSAMKFAIAILDYFGMQPKF